MEWHKRYFVFVAIAAIVVLIPWNGMTLFNTKGEPREAIVAVSMLNQGDWTLPLSHGSDLPYKPPMLAWCIAALGVVLNGGVVNEFISRLPSALACLALVLMTFCYFRRHDGERVGAATALVLLTSVEVLRAGVACRVDMLLTAAIVGAIYMLADIDSSMSARQRWTKRAIALVLMTVATLTKGPVGALLPCMVVGLYRLFKHDNFWRTFFGLALMAILAMVIPACWYYAAYQRGGDDFLNLAIEENIGRLTGHMRYDSHLKPWWYNFITIALGMLPYTLLAITSLVTVNRRKIKHWHMPKLSDSALLSIVAAAAVFVFYCIPSSKRSVYLLPCYPFMAYGIVMLLRRLARRRRRILRVYASCTVGLAIALSAVVLIAKIGLPLGGKLGENAALFQANISVLSYLLCLVPIVVVAWAWRKTEATRIIMPVVALYVVFLGVVQPALLNPRSNKADAERVAAIVAPTEHVYAWIDDDYMRYYALNFYLGDRMRHFDEEMPEKGVVAAADGTDWGQLYPQYDFEETDITFTACDNKQKVRIYTFNRHKP
jgi:4-amino-4-deoxy-L-arabinose transferase-like glycosyltransferase